MPPDLKVADLFAAPKTNTGPDSEQIKSLIAAALDEDLGKAGDLTSKALIDPHLEAVGAMIARQDGVIAGLQCAGLVFKMLEETSRFEALVKDGDFVKAGTKIALISASARALLTGERTALNFIGRLSGIATLTKNYVDEIAHTSARVIDTRKTTPGLRALEKYAVACGGGGNHRMGLYDAILIKDNHIALAGGVAAAYEKARAANRGVGIEIEVDTLDQLDEALKVGAKRILLDNMDVAMLKKAVEKTNKRAVLEASGGVTLKSIKAIAETGVDFISCGALTHSVPNFDVGLDIET